MMVARSWINALSCHILSRFQMGFRSDHHHLIMYSRWWNSFLSAAMLRLNSWNLYCVAGQCLSHVRRNFSVYPVLAPCTWVGQVHCAFIFLLCNCRLLGDCIDLHSDEGKYVGVWQDIWLVGNSGLSLAMYLPIVFPTAVGLHLQVSVVKSKWRLLRFGWINYKDPPVCCCDYRWYISGYVQANSSITKIKIWPNLH